MSTADLLLCWAVVSILFLGWVEYRGKKGETVELKGVELITTVIRRWWREQAWAFVLLAAIFGYFSGHFFACPDPCPVCPAGFQSVCIP